MNWIQLLGWVNDPARTEADLEQLHTALGLGTPAAGTTLADLRNAIRIQISSQPDMNATVDPVVLTNAGIPAPTPARRRTPSPLLIAGTIAAAVAVAAVLLYVNNGNGSGDSNDKANAAGADATATYEARNSTPSGSATVTPNGTPTNGTTGNGTNGTNSGGNTNGTNGNTPTCPGDHVVNAGETYQVSPNCITKGDVEVGADQNGPWSPAHTSDGNGNLLQCPDGCWIQANYGANVSDRTLKSLDDEMKSSGCANNAGCAVVHVWCFTNGSLTEITGGGTCTSSSPKAPTNGNATSCGGELLPGETRMLPAGCIIVGDVVVNNVLQKPIGRNRNDTGYVQQLESDTTVTAPWGAGVYEQSWNVDNLVNTTKQFGCDQDGGCSGGVYDWSGNRLDQ